MPRLKTPKPPGQWTSEARRDVGYARAIEQAAARYRVDRREMEELLWHQTTAAYAADQSRVNTDDPLKPLATRGSDTTFTDDELKDF